MELVPVPFAPKLITGIEDGIVNSAEVNVVLFTELFVVISPVAFVNNAVIMLASEEDSALNTTLCDSTGFSSSSLLHDTRIVSINKGNAVKHNLLKFFIAIRFSF